MDALFTDLYELTMMAGYVDAGRAEDPAVFDLFFRHNPVGVDLVVNAGLDPVLDWLEELAFSEEDLSYLRSLEMFDAAFLDYLADLRFTCDVDAIAEGLPVFGDEPLLRVSGPLGQAQFVETALINRIAYSSLIASNALQMTLAANGKPVLEFGARRAHGPDGALTATRAAIIGGCSATSNVAAGKRYDLPVSGTQAHSWVMAWSSELEAFRAYARTFPDSTILLIDTYDTLEVGLPNALVVARELTEDGHDLQGVRLDSGDLGALAVRTREGLDEAGFNDVRIVVSGDLDAARVADLEAARAPVDGYGVGTALTTARHDPTFSGVYKLAEISEAPVLKISSTPAKTSDPGRKQVWRCEDGDVIGLEDDSVDGRPLLEPVMRGGERVVQPVEVRQLADRCRNEVRAVRPRVLEGRWAVRRTERLAELRRRLVADMADGKRSDNLVHEPGDASRFPGSPTG
ncbi:MAG: nicotinate phosphoribosyltransferase [Egibacteraceae bacterium]